MEMERKRNPKFWEAEDPVVIEENGLRWQMFPKAGKLQITRISTDWNGDLRQRTIALSRADLTGQVFDLLRKFIGRNE